MPKTRLRTSPGAISEGPELWEASVALCSRCRVPSLLEAAKNSEVVPAWPPPAQRSLRVGAAVVPLTEAERRASPGGARGPSGLVSKWLQSDPRRGVLRTRLPTLLGAASAGDSGEGLRQRVWGGAGAH